jgi:hypothetical protein
MDRQIFGDTFVPSVNKDVQAKVMKFNLQKFNERKQELIEADEWMDED